MTIDDVATRNAPSSPPEALGNILGQGDICNRRLPARLGDPAKSISPDQSRPVVRGRAGGLRMAQYQNCHISISMTEVLVAHLEGPQRIPGCGRRAHTVRRLVDRGWLRVVAPDHVFTEITKSAMPALRKALAVYQDEDLKFGAGAG